MKGDIGSNYTLAIGLGAASNAIGAHNSASVDHALAPSAAFYVVVQSVGTGGTVDMKTQYSDNGTDWTDYTAGDSAGNDAAITQITAAGAAQLNVPNPRGRYSRAVVTVGTDACVLTVTNVSGPLRHVAAA